MGKSFVMKDRKGTTAGYLVQGIGALKCRIRGAQDEAKLILFCEDGTIRKRTLRTDCVEQAWQDDTKAALLGAVVVYGEEIYADSGTEASMRYEALKRRESLHTVQEPRKESVTEHIQESGQKSDRKENEKQAETDREERGMRQSELPERRWPPPSCWSEAVYRAGAWTEEKT